MTRIAQVFRRATAGRLPSARLLAFLAAPAVAVLLLLAVVLFADLEPSAASNSVTTPWDAAGPDLVLDYRFYTPTGCAAGATPDCIAPHQGWSDLSYRNVGTQDATGVVVTVTYVASPTDCGVYTTLAECRWDATIPGLICPIIVGDLAVGQVGSVPTYWTSWCNPTQGGTAQITTNITVTDDGATYDPARGPEEQDWSGCAAGAPAGTACTYNLDILPAGGSGTLTFPSRSPATAPMNSKQSLTSATMAPTATTCGPKTTARRLSRPSMSPPALQSWTLLPPGPPRASC